MTVAGIALASFCGCKYPNELGRGNWKTRKWETGWEREIAQKAAPQTVAVSELPGYPGR